MYGLKSNRPIVDNKLLSTVICNWVGTSGVCWSALSYVCIGHDLHLNLPQQDIMSEHLMGFRVSV
jgi:hypothetical protein